MKIINQALSGDVLKEVEQHFQESIGGHVWRSGRLTWPPNIQVGVTHTPLIKQLPEDVADKIYEEMKQYLPERIKKKTIRGDAQICVWDRLAALSSHNDEKYTFAATIYLNKEWHIDNGGLFVWKKKGEKTLRAYVPQSNSAVINDNDEMHLVTPVSAFTHEPRYSIQLWGIGDVS